MSVPLFTHLEGRIPVRPHEHVAVLHRGREAGFRLASFLAEGLRLSHLCVYLAPDDYHTDMLARLRTLSVEVDRYLRDGSLRLHRGVTEYRELRDRTQQVFVEAEQSRAPALRWLEEGVWPDSIGFPIPQFFEFHALLNFQVKHYPGVALCQYDIDQIEIHRLFCAIAVHRHLLVEETLVRDNPFYIPAEKFIPLSPHERERDLTRLFREVGFDVKKLLQTIVGYAQIQQPASPRP